MNSGLAVGRQSKVTREIVSPCAQYISVVCAKVSTELLKTKILAGYPFKN